MSSLSRAMLACSVLLLLIAAPVTAGQITIDNSLADWGVTLGSDDKLDFGFTHTGTSGTGTYNGFSFSYFIEDQSDTAGNGGQLGPHQGGQNYDAEFMGTGIDDGYLVIAIATGQRSDNGFTSSGLGLFAPGDIMITTTNGTFGVEVGGTIDPYGGTTAPNVTKGAVGSTYTLNSHGYTTPTPYIEPNSHTAGSVWKGDSTGPNSVWRDSPTSPKTPTQLIGGTYVDSTNVAYQYSFVTYTKPNNVVKNSQHAFIEVAIPVSVFGAGAMLNSVRWAPACNNDFVMTDFGLNPMPFSTVPEPTSLSLLLIGGLGLCGYRRRRFA